jgi:biopolymer transport protein ExbD
MAEDIGDKLAEGKLDLVPMIDCIMLLLLFFILTTKFSSEEKAIASLLPTDKGPSASTSRSETENKQVNIAIYPAGLAIGLSPEQYEVRVNKLFDESPARVLTDAMVRVGGADPLRIQGRLLAVPGSRELQAHMEQIHAYIAHELESREKTDTVVRKDQYDVMVHCFSGLSWKFALVAYDAVREYERKKGGNINQADRRALENQRAVNFAPPAPRGTQSQGTELAFIINVVK